MKHIYKNFNFYGIMELICEFIRLILQSIKLIYQSTAAEILRQPAPQKKDRVKEAAHEDR